jgi:N-acetyldiaminopimelate deacetylase
MRTGENVFVDLRRQLHRIPEAGYQEVKTQALILDYVGRLSSARLEVRTWHTGVLIHVKGLIGKRRIGYRADMDGLPIQEQTSYPFRSEHEGFMHACGHDLHMAIALGVLTRIVENPVDDDVLFIFQPAEEGPGGALPMLENCDALKLWRPDLILALHIAPEYSVGTIATRPGILFANTSELFIDITGVGGHAAYPHRANDAIVAASALVLQLQTIVSRNMNPLDAAVLTLGVLQAGTKQNIIAEQARLEGTIRTLSQAAMTSIKVRIEALCRGLEMGYGIKTDIDYGANYYQVYNHESTTLQFMSFVSENFPEIRLLECSEAMTGEDFGYFLKEIPGFMFWLGVNTAYGLHHAKMEPDEGAIGIAIRVVSEYMARGNSRAQ